MITACNFVAPNGEPSKLGKYLEEKYGIQEAARRWKVLKNPLNRAQINKAFHESYFEFEQGDLTPIAADYIVEMLDSGRMIDQRHFKNYVDTSGKEIDQAEREADANVVEFKETRVDNKALILKGSQTATLRSEPDFGLVLPGESVLVYIDNKPIRITYDGFRVSENLTQDTMSLGLSLGLPIEKQFNDRMYKAKENKKVSDAVNGWLDGSKRMHKYSFERVNSVEAIINLLKDTNFEEFNPTKEIDMKALNKSIRTILPAVLDSNGKETGEFFSFELMNSSLDYINRFVNILVKDMFKSGKDKMTTQMLIDALVKGKLNAFAESRRYKSIKEGTADDKVKAMFKNLSEADLDVRISSLDTLYNSYAELVPFVLDRLVRVGQRIDSSAYPKIVRILNKQFKELQKAEENKLDEDTLILDENEVNQAANENSDVLISEETVLGVTDWSKDAIHVDPMVTASRNVKMFLTTLPETKFGEQTPPNKKTIDFSPEYLKKRAQAMKERGLGYGPKNYTLTQEQFDALNGEKTFTFEFDGEVLQAEGVAEIPAGTNRIWSTLDPNAKYFITANKFKPHNREPKPLTNAEFGSTVYSDATTLFQNLLREAQKAQKPEVEYFIQVFKKSSVPSIVFIGNLLEKNLVPDDVISSIKLAIDKQYVEHFIQSTRAEEKVNVPLIRAQSYSANTTAEIRVLRDSWREAQKINGLVVDSGNGAQTFNFQKLEGYEKQYKSLFAEMTDLYKLAKKKGAPDLFNELQESIARRATTITKNFLKDSGIELPDVAIKELLGVDNMTSGSFFRYSTKLEYALDPRSYLRTMLKAYFRGDTSFDRGDYIRNNNPLYTENKIVNSLARLYNKHTTDPIFGITHKTSDGKIAFAFTNHTHESRSVQALKDPESMLSKQLRDIMPVSWFLDQFHIKRTGDMSDTDYETRSSAAEAKLMYLDGLRAEEETVGRTDMSMREQFVTSLNAFFRNGGKSASFVDMTKSDKTMTPVFHDMRRLSNVGATEEFIRIANVELDRYKKWHADNASIKNKRFNSGGQYFYLLPMMNSKEELLNVPGLSPELLNSAFVEINGRLTLDPNIKPIVFNKIVDSTFRYVRQNEAKDLLEYCHNEGIIGKDQDKDRVLISDDAISRYIDEMNENFSDTSIVARSISKKNGLVYSINGDPSLSSEFVRDYVLTYMLQNYVSNYMVFNGSMAMLVSGDPAFFYKKAKDKKNADGSTTSATVMDHIGSTLIEYQKRLAKDVAPGLDPSWKVDETYKTITISDPEFVSSFYGEYDTAADAQEYTTVSEHLYVLNAAGKIPNNIFKEMSEIIAKAKGGYYEFTQQRHLQYVMQPMKPVYVNRRFENGLMQMDYVKTSSFPLLPQLFKGTSLDKLRVHMENKGIARAVFSSGAKAGSPTKALDLFDENGFVKDAALNDTEVEAATNVLMRGGFRIQQEVPYEPLKKAIHTVTQMDKLIVEGIEVVTDFELRGEKLTGDQIRARKEENRKRLYKQGFEAFVEKIGGMEISKQEGDSVDDHIIGRLKDPDKFYERLTQEAIAMGYPKPDIDALRDRVKGELRMPLWFNGSANKLEALIMSMVTKIVISKTPGKSYIQGSSLGIKFATDEDFANSGIVFFDSENNSFDREKGLQYVRKGQDGKIIPAQVLVPFNFEDGNGNLLDINDFTKTTEDGRKVLNPELFPKELLQLVGARIPNQGFSSMLPIEIVGFIPHQMGDMVFVPAEITQQMGADFDVDKLYTYRRNYKWDADSATLSLDASQYNEEQLNQDGELVTPKDREKGLQNEYFDIHWSILNHPEIFERYTKKLDKSDLVDEMELAKSLNTATEDYSTNFFSPMKQLSDFNAQKDAKALVAQSSLFSTFASDIQRHNIHLSKIEKVGDSFERVRHQIDVMDESGQVLKLSNLSGRGISEYTPDGKEREKADDGIRSKVINNTIMQNEFLDYSKNRTIDFFNLNVVTYPAAATLMMLSTDEGTTDGKPNAGKALNLKFVTRMLQQESIVDFVKTLASAEDNYSNGFGDAKKRAYDVVVSQLKKRAQIDSKEEIKPEIFSPQSLLSLLKTADKNEPGYIRSQIAVLDMFMEVSAIAKQLQQVMSNYNTDTKGPGGSVVKALDRLSKNSSIMGYETISGIEEFLKTSQKGAAYKNVMNAVFGAFSDIFPHAKLQGVFHEVMMHTAPEVFMNEEMFYDLANHLKAYIFSTNVLNTVEDVEKTAAYFLYSTDKSKSLAVRVEEAKSTFKTGKSLLGRLAGNISTDSSEPSTVIYKPVKSSTFELEENYRSFMEMLMSEDVEESRLAQDLIKYTLITDGSGGNTSLMRFIPASYFTINGTSSALRSLMKSDSWSEMLANFVPQYLQHNPDKVARFPSALKNTSIRHTVSKSGDKTFVKIRRAPEHFIFDTSKLESEHIHLRPFYTLKVKGTSYLYKLIDNAGDNPIYQRIDKLGNGYIKEYNPNVKLKRSVISNNRARYEAPLYDDMSGIFAPTASQQYTNLPKAYLAKTVGPMGGIFGEQETASLYTVQSSIKAPVSRLMLELATLVHGNNITFKSEALGENIEGKADSSGLITLNPGLVRDQGTLDRLIAHEALHLVTLKIFNDFNTDFEGSKNRYDTAVAKAYKNLEAMRMELIGYFAGLTNAQLLEEGMLELQAEMEHALSSADEFAAALISNQKFQEFLNNRINSKGKSLFERAVQLVKQIINGLAKQFGIQVKEGSELEYALNNLGQVIISSYGMQSSASVGYELGLSAYSKKATPKKMTTDLESSIEDLVTMKKQLYNLQAITKDKNSPEYADRAKQINDLDMLIKDVKSNPDYSALFIGAELQLAYAEKLIELGKGNTNELLNGLTTATTLMSIIDRAFGNMSNKPARIDEILSRAKTVESNIIWMFQNLAVKADGSLLESIRDFDPKSLEAGVYGKFGLRAINQFDSRVAQDIANKISGANMIKTTEERRFFNKLEAMHKKVDEMAKERGISSDDLLAKIMKQGNRAWGFVDVFSEQYYQDLEDMQDNYSRAHFNMHSKNNIKFVNNVRNNTKRTLADFSFVNVASILDPETGELRTDKKATEEIARYKALLDPTHPGMAEDTIQKLQEEYKEYLSAFETYKTNINEQTENRLNNVEKVLEAELATLTPREATKRIMEEKARIRAERKVALETFEQNNSSLLFYKNLDAKLVSGTDVKNVQPFKNWKKLHLYPLPSKSKYFDKNMADIANDKQILEVYNFFRDNFSMFKEMLPPNIVEDLRDDFIPVIKSNEKGYSGFSGLKDHFGRTLMEGISHETDYVEYTKTGKSRIPIRFTSPESVDVKDRERNLFVLMEKFSKMALHFKYMAGVQSYAELMAHTINRAVTQGPGGADMKYKNQAVQDMYNAVTYHMDTLMYQKPKKIEGTVDTKQVVLYGDNLLESGKIKKELQVLEGKLIDLKKLQADTLEDFKDDKITKAEHDKIVGQINADRKKVTKQLDAIKATQRVVNFTAIADSAIKFTQLKMLGWSPMAAAANLTFGIITAYSHASTGLDFNEAQLFDALRIATNSTRRSLGASENEIAEKIANLIDRAGTMGDIIQLDTANLTKTEVKAKGWRRVLSPFQMMRQSDYYMKATMIVAMAKNTIIKKDDGTTSTLWDALNTDGSIDGASAWYNAEDASAETEFLKFSRRAIGVNNMIMGNQDPNSPLLARKTALGRLLGQFKLSWLPEAWAVRFQKEIYVADMDRNVKGSLITFAEQWRNYGTHSITFLTNIHKQFSTVEFMAKNGEKLSPTDLANMRRNASDLRTMILLTMATLMLKGLKDAVGDDEDDIYLQIPINVTLNLLARNFNDITYFINVNTVEDFTKSTVLAASIVSSVSKAIKGVYKLVTQDEDSRFTAKQAMYRWFRLVPGLNMIPSLENTATKLISEMENR